MSKTYDGQTAKFIATIAQAMPDIPADIMQGWIQNPGSLKSVLAKTLCPLGEALGSQKWINIGGNSLEAYFDALKQTDIELDSWLEEVFRAEKYKTRTHIEHLRLIFLTTEELVLHEDEITPFNESILDRVEEQVRPLGLTYCPFEAVLQFPLKERLPSGYEQCLFVTQTIWVDDGENGQSYMCSLKDDGVTRSLGLEHEDILSVKHNALWAFAASLV